MNNALHLTQIQVLQIPQGFRDSAVSNFFPIVSVLNRLLPILRDGEKVIFPSSKAIFFAEKPDDFFAVLSSQYSVLSA